MAATVLNVRVPRAGWWSSMSGCDGRAIDFAFFCPSDPGGDRGRSSITATGKIEPIERCGEADKRLTRLQVNQRTEQLRPAAKVLIPAYDSKRARSAHMIFCDSTRSVSRFRESKKVKKTSCALDVLLFSPRNSSRAANAASDGRTTNATEAPAVLQVNLRSSRYGARRVARKK